MLEHLKNIGLSDNEAKVYLAMLELRPATVIDIARKAAVNRPTTYVQIELLKQKGLASTQTKGKKHLYIAEWPSGKPRVPTSSNCVPKDADGQGHCQGAR